MRERDAKERQWMAQWRHAAVALAEVRARELSQMTHDESLAASDALLSLERPGRIQLERESSSGLIEMQRLLRRRAAR